jgi:nitrite reductase/ring-hydroxylating ferredoxin subunit
VSALPTAAAGLADWIDTWGKTRRIGVAHAVGNITAVTMFGASLVARRAGSRKLGFTLSSIGMGVATLSAYLGGHLTFGKGIGVDTTSFDEEPLQWTEVLTVDELSDGKLIHADADGADVLLFRDGDDVFAISDRCTHRGCSLSEGEVKTGTVICPCHGSTFRLADGGVVRGPATAPQPAYDTRIVDGRVEVKVRTPRH